MSGNPADMLGYFQAADEQTAGWENDAVELRAALEALRAGMEEVPEPYQVVLVEDYEGEYEYVVAEQRHLDTFVRDVAHELLEADGYGYVITGDLPVGGEISWPDGMLTVDESAIDVGSPSLFMTYAEPGAADAEELTRLLITAGVLDSDGSWDLSYDPDGIFDPDDPKYAAVVEQLELVGAEMSGLDDIEAGLYAGAFYNTLGADGTMALGSIFNDLANREELADFEYGDIPVNESFTRLLADPLIEGFAMATPHLDAAMVDELTTFDEHLPTAQRQAVALSIMLTAPGELYDPRFLADTADSMFFDAHTSLTVAQAITMRALAENPTAAEMFIEDDNGELLSDHLAMLLISDPVALSVQPDEAAGIWLNTTRHDLPELYDLWGMSALAHATGLPISYRDENGIEIQHGWGWRQYASFGADCTPFVGTGKAWVEVTTGQDYVGGDPVNRYIAALGLIPFGGIFKKLGGAIGNFIGWVRRGFKFKQTSKGVPLPENYDEIFDGLVDDISTTRTPTTGTLTRQDPLGELSPQQLEEFLVRLRQGIGGLRGRWPRNNDEAESILGRLPKDHPFKGFEASELIEFGLDFEDAIDMLRAGEGAKITDNLPLQDITESYSFNGKTDWEVYQIIRPIIGDIHVPGVSTQSIQLDYPEPFSPFQLAADDPNWGERWNWDRPSDN